MIKRYLLILAAILSTNLFIYSQSVTNSPYTRFGIGEMDRNGFNNSKAMGGLATGLRAQNQINYLNPAAISSQDTMSFIFDVGVTGIFKNMESSTASAEFKDFGFDHFAISFPVKRWWFASLGVTPYSKIGYNIQQTSAYDPIDSVNMHYDYYGNGGINQLFLANSFKFFDKFSVGFNLNYLFGSLEQYKQVYLDRSDSYGTLVADQISLNKLTYDIGVQYFNEINQKYFYVVGVTYSNKTKFNSTKETTVFMTENFGIQGIGVIDYLANVTNLKDTISSSVDHNFKVEIPQRFSIGISGGIKNKLTLGFDYSYQDWSNVNSLNIDNSFAKDESFNVGVEYVPDMFSLKNYYKRIYYRAGMFLNNSYLNLNGKQIQNYGITFGLGLPVVNGRTSLNISYTYGKRGTTNNGLIEENYSLIGINLTLYDFWFIKRKFQ